MSEGLTKSDRMLLAEYLRGDGDAATSLYMRYAERLHALAARKTATDLKGRTDPDDIVQSVFRTFFRRADRGEYQAPIGDELWNLFFVIALNKVRKFGVRQHAMRRDSRRTVAIGDDDIPSPGSEDEDWPAYRALRMTIDDLLEKLPDDVRQVIAHRIEGYEIAEIAQKTGRARRSIERMLHNFRAALAAELEDS